MPVSESQPLVEGVVERSDSENKERDRVFKKAIVDTVRVFRFAHWVLLVGVQLYLLVLINGAVAARVERQLRDVDSDATLWHTGLHSWTSSPPEALEDYTARRWETDTALRVGFLAFLGYESLRDLVRVYSGLVPSATAAWESFGTIFTIGHSLGAAGPNRGAACLSRNCIADLLVTVVATGSGLIMPFCIPLPFAALAAFVRVSMYLVLVSDGLEIALNCVALKFILDLDDAAADALAELMRTTLDELDMRRLRQRCKELPWGGPGPCTIGLLCVASGVSLSDPAEVVALLDDGLGGLTGLLLLFFNKQGRVSNWLAFGKGIAMACFVLLMPVVMISNFIT